MIDWRSLLLLLVFTPFNTLWGILLGDIIVGLGRLDDLIDCNSLEFNLTLKLIVRVLNHSLDILWIGLNRIIKVSIRRIIRHIRG